MADQAENPRAVQGDNSGLTIEQEAEALSWLEAGKGSPEHHAAIRADVSAIVGKTINGGALQPQQIAALKAIDRLKGMNAAFEAIGVAYNRMMPSVDRSSADPWMLHRIAVRSDNEHGRCFDTTERLAQSGGIQDRAARDRLQRLVECGLLNREKVPGGNRYAYWLTTTMTIMLSSAYDVQEAHSKATTPIVTGSRLPDGDALTGSRLPHSNRQPSVDKPAAERRVTGSLCAGSSNTSYLHQLPSPAQEAVAAATQEDAGPSNNRGTAQTDKASPSPVEPKTPATVQSAMELGDGDLPNGVTPDGKGGLKAMIPWASEDGQREGVKPRTWGLRDIRALGQSLGLGIEAARALCSEVLGMWVDERTCGPNDGWIDKFKLDCTNRHASRSTETVADGTDWAAVEVRRAKMETANLQSKAALDEEDRVVRETGERYRARMAAMKKERV